MSKGIGKGYLQRMSRWHKPKNIKNPYERITKIVDRALYHDGAFGFKLPRYYRDRLYRLRFPCDAKVWNKKRKIYENKIVYRYKSKNLLAIQMQIEIRDRILAEYDRRIAELRQIYPDKSDNEIHIEYLRLEKVSALDRQKTIYTKLSRFYNTNRFKNKKL